MRQGRTLDLCLTQDRVTGCCKLANNFQALLKRRGVLHRNLWSGNYKQDLNSGQWRASGHLLNPHMLLFGCIVGFHFLFQFFHHRLQLIHLIPQTACDGILHHSSSLGIWDGIHEHGTNLSSRHELQCVAKQIAPILATKQILGRVDSPGAFLKTRQIQYIYIYMYIVLVNWFLGDSLALTRFFSHLPRMNMNETLTSSAWQPNVPAWFSSHRANASEKHRWRVSDIPRCNRQSKARAPEEGKALPHLTVFQTKLLCMET